MFESCEWLWYLIVSLICLASLVVGVSMCWILLAVFKETRE